MSHAETLPAAKLGQQLTMTPQLQQAIRLLQLPALELQAHIRELLETQRDARAGGGSRSHRHARGARAPPTPSRPRPPSAARAKAPSKSSTRAGASAARASETPWAATTTTASRSSPTPPGSRCRNTCSGSSSSRSLEPRELAIARAIVDAISDDGYLTESLEEIAATLRPEIECDAAEVERVLAGRAGARSARRRRALGRRVHRAAAAAARSGHARVRRRASRSRGSTWSCVAGRELVARCDGSSARPRRSSPRALALVRSCHPRPGATVSTGAAEYVVPDVFVRRTRSRLGGRDQLRHAAARAPQSELRRASSAATPATPRCARSCRRRAGCSRAWKSATKR